VSAGELQILDLEHGGAPTSVELLGESDKADLHWSPDGSRVAFLSKGSLYMVEVDGSGDKQLTGDALLQPGDGGEPLVIDSIRWSPGGTKIAFAVVQPSVARGVCS
jgi:hypothetical protein